MFQACEFTFAGESSLMYNMMLYDIDGNGQTDVSFGNKADIVETRTNNRVTPLHFGVNYNKSPLSFKLVFGTDEPLDRFALQDISFWLTGYQQYQWLSIDQPDMEHLVFRCLVTELKPITVGWIPYAFEATVTCDCPYAYGHPFEKQYIIDGKTDVLFRNDSSVREFIKPSLSFIPKSGTTSLSIVNKNDGGREFLLEDLPSSGISVAVDNQNGIIRELNYGYNLYDGFNRRFFRMVHGDNNLELTGDGTLTLSGRFLYNVAG